MGLNESAYLTILKTVLRRVAKKPIEVDINEGQLDFNIEGFKVSLVPREGGLTVNVKEEK